MNQLPAIALPHRITFLGSRLRLPAGGEGLEQPAALILFLALFEHLVRHPSVAVTDPDDFRVADDEGRIYNFEHPAIERLRSIHFSEGRREELLCFDVSLDPAQPAPVRLLVERHDGVRGSFEAPPNAPLSDAIAICLQQWLGAIGRPPPPRPIEPFTAADVLDAARRGLAVIQARGQSDRIALDPPERLRVPYFRFVATVCNTYMFEEILAIDGDNPWALRDLFMHAIHNNGSQSRDPIKAAIQVAPMFGKLYLSMFGEGISQDEQLRAFAMAAILIPGNAYSLADYGYALDRAGRWAEALRYGDRATDRAPDLFRGHLLGFEVVDLCRYGRALSDSFGHLGWLEHLAEKDVIDAGDPDFLHCKLRHSSQLMRAGRLEEAIALRAELLEGLEERWTNQTKVLRDWQSDPATFAQLYAREASMRGDPGRVVEGFAAAAPGSGSEVGMLVEAHLALGDDDLALMAYGHRLRTNFVQNPITRLPGAKAFLANGDLAGAIDCIHGSALRFPTAGWDTAHDRLLRAAASAPTAAWDAIIKGHLDRGARRLAWFVARDAADFVPGIAAAPSVQAALAPQRPLAFDPGMLASLHGGLASFGLDEIDRFFGSATEPTLVTADRLVAGWTALIPPAPEGRSREEHAPRASKILWVFASAFGRYLAATTGAPTPLAGGYRQIAGGALEMLAGVRGIFPRHVIRFLLEGIERIAPAVDVWLLDSWLLRLERALDLEFSVGHLGALAAGLPVVSSLLRGDEQVSHELNVAFATNGAPAVALLERCVRAVGRGPASKWSEVAAASLPPDERLDLHLTASFIANTFAGPGVEAAKIFFARGATGPAFEVLATSFANGGKQWRDKQLAVLAPLWNAAKMPCPIDFSACVQAGNKGLQTGDFQLAVAAHRWLAAMDPDNATIWKNLGMAYGYVGKPVECIAAFARASVAEAPKWAAQLLRQAGHHAAATTAYRYASSWFTTGDEWSWLAVAAYVATDYETAAESFERAFELNAALATPANLNYLCDALQEMRANDRLLRAADRMIGITANDPVFGPNAAFHRACALIGLGRHAEAVPSARDAVARNTLPDNAGQFADIAARAAEGRGFDAVTLKRDAAERRAGRRLERGEFDEVAALEKGPANWKLGRVALAAARFRSETENDDGVTPRLREAAIEVLEKSAGDTGIDAGLARAEALYAREQVFFPVEPPCPLGTRVPREEFGRIFAQKSGRGGAAATAVAAAASAAAQGDADPVILGGTKLPRLSDYARLMKGLMAGNMQGAIAAEGLDMTSYSQLATAWGKKLAEDPVLAAKFQKLMSG